MNSTGSPGGSRGSIRWPLTRRWVFAALSWLVFAPALAQDNPMPRPPQLERDVQFWIRVYTQIDTNAGFLHDQYNLSVIYDTLHFAPNTTPAERERQVDQARERYGGALRRVADAADAPLSADDQRIKELWGAEGTPARLRSAIDDIRFQLGQADRFRAGLIRSGAWETHIAETLANLGLPAELAVLPHVESSFNPAAYSKVGAAGLWQFMRSTGRRYMRIDSAVDDRLDPFRSTEAAAQLLAYNYRVLGTWPLALTAYNHGTAGVRRAKETLGTDDIARIVRSYNSRTFGFASRNFYVSFLAALDIDRNPEKYFGALQRQSEARFQEVQVPAYVPMTTLERALRIDADKLRALNPALLRSVWDGQQRVPRAYHLRLPLNGSTWTRELLAQRLSPAEMFAGQSSPPRYRVQRGDTLTSVAGRYGVSADTLARLNHLRTGAQLHAGRTITVPETPPVTVAAAAPPAAAAPAPTAATSPAEPAPAAPAPTAATSPAAPAPAAPALTAATPRVALARPSPGGAVPAAVAQRESAEDAAVAAAAAKSRTAATSPQPVSAAQAEALSPALGPAAEAEQNPDPNDYSVAHDDTIRVAGDETLGHYADWLGVSTQHVRELNRFKFHRPVLIGQRIKLDFRKVSREAFEANRREYHRQLQAAYFAAHRIVGTEVYIARPGDSVWTLTQRTAQMPMWLVQQYNPDVDLADLRAGTQIVMPRVEEVGSGG
ncbi:MAG: LysM peptidoglycan-binding domain-containing protein [Gammaproteobacteria bacterium]|nr:MAG: LysM peptidoglycan-binding domain-containing protein [Gammaproteobacteria bacterium]